MVSNKTVDSVVDLLWTWATDCDVSTKDMHYLLDLLSDVKGNKSFVDSLSGITKLFKERHPCPN